MSLLLRRPAIIPEEETRAESETTGERSGILGEIEERNRFSKNARIKGVYDVRPVTVSVAVCCPGPGK